jgi:dihydropteroate synthase
MSDFIYRFGDKEYNLSARTHIMGVLNVTPDSFSDGGRFGKVTDAVLHGITMEGEGADFIDVGGESTRPGSEPVPMEVELDRVIPVIKKLKKRVKIPISIDTYKAEVADEALKSGATIVNDISGLCFDGRMADVVRSRNASVILMHTKGNPKTMQEQPHYDDVVNEIKQHLAACIRKAVDRGIRQVIVDPGIGFGKRVKDNLEIIRRLPEFESLGYPILIGPSRKSFIGAILNVPVNERVEGTAASVAISSFNGANVIRVHDVKEMSRVAKIVDAIKHPQRY